MLKAITTTARLSCLIAGLIVLSAVFSPLSMGQQSQVSQYFPEIKISDSNGPSAGHFFLATKGLVAPEAQHYIAIVDNYGTPVFFRLMPNVSLSMRLLNDGTIGYVHGVPRKLYIMNEMLNVTDTINTVGLKLDGHDWEIDDNGNYHRYVFAQYNRIVDMSLLVEGGNVAAEIGEAEIQEFDTDNNLVNTWKTEDLFDILDSNEESPFVDFLEASIDYAHMNSIAIWSDTSFIISTRHMDEITCIDRRSGEIIWRLGGKKSSFTFINDPIGFNHQHCPRKLSNGNILIFDNGNLHDPQFSSAVEYSLDLDNMTASLVKRYRHTPDAFAPRDGSSQRLPAGNTIITWGPAWPAVTEFHPDGTMAVELDMTEHSMSPRVEKYKWKTKVFETSVDSLDFGVYDGSNPVELVLSLTNNTDTVMHITSVESRSQYFETLSSLPLAMNPGAPTDITFRFDPGESGMGYFNDMLTICSDNDVQRIARQVFVEGRQEDNIAPEATIMPDSSNVPVAAYVTISFTEAVRHSDGSEILHGDLEQLFILRKEDATGDPVEFRAIMNSDKNKVTLMPVALLDSSGSYYVDISSSLEDYSGNLLTLTPVTFFTVGPTASGKLPEEPGFNIFPNPTTGMISVDAPAGYNRLSIYTSTGIRVGEKKINERGITELDLSGFSKGVYFVILRSDSNKLTSARKLVIR